MIEAIQSMMTSSWGWPLAECLHFVGLCLLFGTVGCFDLRLLGVARGIDPRSLHRLVPIGVAGFAISAITGSMFVLTMPDQYLHNPAFLSKMALMLVAAINMAAFYAMASRRIWRAGEGGILPRSARLFAAVSLLCWLGVIACGRVITAFRPPAFYWCPWC